MLSLVYFSFFAVLFQAEAHISILPITSRHSLFGTSSPGCAVSCSRGLLISSEERIRITKFRIEDTFDVLGVIFKLGVLVSVSRFV